MKRLLSLGLLGFVLMLLAAWGGSDEDVLSQASPDTYEPPIYVIFNVHFDPVLDDYRRWKGRKDNLLWLQPFVEGYSGIYRPKFNLKVQGALYEAGHSFGTHELTRYSSDWENYPYALKALARALAHYVETGSLPELVETHDLLGPTAYRSSEAVEATLPAEAVLEAAVTVTEGLVEEIPSQVAVGDFRVNPAEFLYLMAQEALALAGSGPASAPVALRPLSLLPLSIFENEQADPLTKLQFWTYKPAVFSE